jgi:hypothetical protein
VLRAARTRRARWLGDVAVTHLADALTHPTAVAGHPTAALGHPAGHAPLGAGIDAVCDPPPQAGAPSGRGL